MSDELDALQRKIDKAKGQADRESHGEPGDVPVNFGYAMRFTVELLAGIAAGCGLGYFADRWFGTFPWLLILGFFFGAAAGFRNLLREANDDEHKGK